jgi:hypothetical protein
MSKADRQRYHSPTNRRADKHHLEPYGKRRPLHQLSEQSLPSATYRAMPVTQS